MNSEKKNFLNQVFKRSKATLILVGFTVLFIFYLMTTKTEPEIIDAPEKVWPIEAAVAEYKNITPQLKYMEKLLLPEGVIYESLLVGK